MREHERKSDMIRRAHDRREDVESRPEPFRPNTFGYT